MKTVVVKYRVRADRASENEAYIRQVFAQLVQEKPSGVSYNVYKLEDGVSFMHIASIAPRKRKNPLTTLKAFQAFAEKIEDRCEESPVFTDASSIGSFNGTSIDK